ncbi:MAG: hypothetical protein JRJ01_15925 [Deltaproteobacteria bacterium]|nr:hypothetical protein [Deltaproteobacteria bacterium]
MNVTTGTQPDEITPEDLLFESQEGHPNDLQWVENIIHGGHRATRHTGPAGKTRGDLLTTRLLGQLLPELWIGLAQIDVSHGTLLEILRFGPSPYETFAKRPLLSNFGACLCRAYLPFQRDRQARQTGQAQTGDPPEGWGVVASRGQILILEVLKPL